MGRKKKKKSKIIPVILTVVALVIVATLLFGYHFYSYIYKQNVDLEKDQISFYIRSNWDFNTVSNELKSQGIIKNQESFEWVSEQKNYTNRIKPGKYHIPNNSSNDELVNLLRSGNQSPVQVTFHNISRLTQLASLVSKQIEADSTELMTAFLSRNWMKENELKEETVQAIFIPNTYELYWNTSGKQFTDRMFSEFQHFWNVDNKKKAKEIGLNPIKVSILASIVEAETKKKDEMPKVAGLYLNRLTIGMRLQSDPTIVFAMNKPGVHRVYYDDLKIDSPYNTYTHSGLPPGPIGFPSTTALNAVLNQHQSRYIYMCAKPDYSGYHNFANSYNQHLKYARIYRAFLRKEGIR